MPGFMLWFLAGAADPDRPRERGAIAGRRRGLKVKFFVAAAPVISVAAAPVFFHRRRSGIFSRPPSGFKFDRGSDGPTWMERLSGAASTSLGHFSVC
jgi:hypothetical protein